MNPTHKNNLLAGITLIASSVLTVFAMLHHPVAHSHNFEELVAEIDSFQGVNQWVHAGAIGMMMLMVLGLSYLGSRLGFERIIVRGAMISFCMGAIAMVGAATIDGFVIHSFLGGFEIRGETDAELGYAILRVFTSINRTLALLGVFMMSTGALLFGTAALCCTRPLQWVGWLGVLTGVLGCAGLYTGYIQATAHGMIVFASLIGSWLVVVGVLLIRWKDVSKEE
ncbi:MAG: hypothetical protein AAF497_01525 [Planctomycetota bacterium]